MYLYQGECCTRAEKRRCESRNGSVGWVPVADTHTDPLYIVIPCVLQSAKPTISELDHLLYPAELGGCSMPLGERK